MGNRVVSIETVAKAAAELREKNHPYFTYKPGKTAERCARSKCRHMLLSGPNGSGKTYAMAHVIAQAMVGDLKGRPNKKNSRYMLFCLSRNQAHNLWRELLLGLGATPEQEGIPTHNRGLIPHWLIGRKKNGRLDIAWDSAQGRPVPKKINMANGNTLDFYWHGSSHQWEHLQGTAYDGAFLDEAGDETEQLLAEVEMRFREALSEGGKNAGWVLWGATDTTANEDFDKWKQRGKDKCNEHYAYFEIKPGENPIMTKEVLDTLAAGMDEEEAEIRVWGTKTRGDELKILTDFNEDIHVMDTDYIPSDRDNVFIVYDPGVSDDSGIMVAHTNPRQPKRIVITKFLTPRGLSVNGDAEIILSELAPYKMRAFIFDKHGSSRREKTSGCKTIIQSIRDVLNKRDVWANGPCYSKPPGQVKDGILAIVGKLTEILDDGKPALLISKPWQSNQRNQNGNGLHKLIRELKSYRKKMNALGKELTTGNIHQKNNEGPDCLRYICLMDPHWVDYGANGASIEPSKDPRLSDYERQMADMKKRHQARRAFARKAKAGRARMQDLFKKLGY